ncbi:MAG TPA: manganese catalase family protein [Chloroflexota bacterium]|nr:manganese catalase family protein [Chloroflexota bacterium]
MFLHNKKMMYTVHVDEPNPQFAKLLLEQFGGPNGELAAAFRYFTQAWADPDVQRRDMLLDIATEELSHLEMVGQTLVQLLKGSPGEMLNQVESGYLGSLMEGQHEKYMELALNSGQNVVGGPGPRLTDSMGNPWTAAYIDTIGEPTADLRSDIAAEARAKLVYERLIMLNDDAGCKDTLGFLMTREIAHQKMFEAALDAIKPNFPPGKLPEKDNLGHTYYKDSHDGKKVSEKAAAGYQLAEQNSGDWSFQLVEDPAADAPKQGAL